MPAIELRPGFFMFAIVLAALDRRPHGLFVFIALAGLVFTVTPLNIVDVPVYNQERRLEAGMSGHPRPR